VGQRSRAFIVTAACCAPLLLLCHRVMAQSAAPDDSLSQFESVLQDPNAVAANLTYAASLQAAGQSGEAQQIYQKVLSLDPNNALARAALTSAGATGGQAAIAGATPPPSGTQTDYTLRLGLGYESNSARLPPVFSGAYPDAVGFGEFTINDTRRLGDTWWQSNLDIYGNAHVRYSPGDIDYVTIDSGPVFDLGGLGRLRVAASGEYALQGQTPTEGDHIPEFLFDAGNMVFNWFPARSQALQSVNLLVGYDHFAGGYNAYRSGVVMHATAPFVFDDLIPATHTQLTLTPGFVYNGASSPNVTPLPQPAHYLEGDLDVLTLTPLAEHQLGAERVVGKLGIFADAQYYDSHDPIPTNDRQDIQLIPIIGVRLVGFLWPRLQLDLDYRYDRNFSNDAAQRFADHIVSLIGTIRF
jgi:hypothetical protein